MTFATGERAALSRPLRIAMLAPIAWRVPPRHYGPWERVVSILTEGLVESGADVTLFATADSVTSARLHAVIPCGYNEKGGVDVKAYECLHIAAVFERASQFDLIHNHFDFLPLTYSRLVDTPVVTTVHGFSSERILPVYKRYNDIVHYVALSAANRHPALDYAATIHLGVPLDEFTFQPQPDDYLVFFGRIHPEKGTHTAIDVAERVGMTLVIAGIIADEQYYRTLVEPRIDGNRIRHVGSVGPEERRRLLGGAVALLHLIAFEEPFGLSVVEALASGTPVIAYRRGSMPEIVDDGKTGFLVDDVDGAIEAIARLSAIDRHACRDVASRRFSAPRMVNEYFGLYERILEDPSLRRSASNTT